MKEKDFLQTLFSCFGIEIGGKNPWDIQVKDDRFYKAASRGSLGFGEAYMEGFWECEALNECIARLLKNGIKTYFPEGRLSLRGLLARAMNLQTKRRSFASGEWHYNIGNDLYMRMLDERMVYTCGYWQNAKTLSEAQEKKLDLVCKKIGLQFGDRVLDIGCGWGSFAKYAAETYGAHVVGITVSEAQASFARKYCQGLPVEIRVSDYRDIDIKEKEFHHIVSLGMFEHVGPKNYRTYFKVAHRLLRKNGLFLLHTIGRNSSVLMADAWASKYIFPDGVIPSMAQIGQAVEHLFVTEDLHNFGAHYEKTLLAWHRNFTLRWHEIAEQYGERFRRMWEYYLLSCAGAFQARDLQLWQFVFSKEGMAGGYRPVR